MQVVDGRRSARWVMADVRGWGAGCPEVSDEVRWDLVAVSFQLVIDCTDPERLCRFWAAALGYKLEPPPAGFAAWDDYWRDVGVAEEELGLGADRIADPGGAGPRIGSRRCLSPRRSRTACTWISAPAAGGLFRSLPESCELTPRRGGWPAWPTVVGVLEEEGLDHYAVAMNDPEGNEFDIN